MFFDLHLMKLFLLLKLLLNIVVEFTLEWGYRTHLSHRSTSQQSGCIYFGRLEVMSVVLFLFKAAIGTLAEYLMFCFQRKEMLQFRKNVLSRCGYIYICIYALYIFICIYLCILYFVYILEISELLKLLQLIFKTKTDLSNIHHRAFYAFFHLSLNIKLWSVWNTVAEG